MQLEPIPPDAPELVAALQTESLPADDLVESGGHFFRLIRQGEVLGFGGFERHGDYTLLRSIVVYPHGRGRGTGQAITQELLQRSAEMGATAAYLLTTTAAAFFEGIGFHRIGREAAPAEIVTTKQASSLCPSSATLLTCRLGGSETPRTANPRLHGEPR